MQAFHDLGVVHKDLRSENMVVDRVTSNKEVTASLDDAGARRPVPCTQVADIVAHVHKAPSAIVSSRQSTSFALPSALPSAAVPAAASAQKQENLELVLAQR